jgi:tRNA A37 threonylcarbamoyladenosine modification protein TsaB
LDNYLIFDVSSQTLFYCGNLNQDQFIFQREFQRGEMNRKLPEVITELKEKLQDNSNATVIIGTGPGSFTGLKTGLSMFISMLYSIGITKIRTVSSLKLFYLLSSEKADYTLSISPFNRDELFFALFDKNGKDILPDTHTGKPYEKLKNASEVSGKKSVCIISLNDFDDEIRETLDNLFGKTTFAKPSFPDRDILEYTEEIDLTKDPLLLNYIAYPANINASQNIYVNSFERSNMKIENVSINEITEKLQKLREEHRRFDEMSDSLSQKSYLTPTDEMELNTLRKKKLLKKDMISYYENVLEKQSS